MRLIPPIFHITVIDYRYSSYHYVLLTIIVVLGAWLRFWGLDNVGLHGDEKTMIFPTLQVLESGLPYLPSGMLYPRGLGQIYLMALAAWLFGPVEWALRIPSAVTGSAAILIMFYLGKRFLPPRLNLVLVLIVAVLPEMIIQSQTARMYIFLSTFVMLYVVLLFRWERKTTWSSLGAAVASLLLALLFHQLAIFSAFLFFFPGLVHRSRQLLAQGAVAFSGVLGAFLPYRYWIGSQYGDTWKLGVASQQQAPPAGFELLLEQHLWALLGAVVVAVIILGMILYISRQELGKILWAWGFFVGATISCLLLQYHIGIIFFVTGAVIYIRSQRSLKPFIVFSLFLLALFILQLALLWQYPDLFPSLKKILRAMTGQPSVWPYLRFANFFPLSVVAYSVVLLFAATQLARRQTIPDHFLFFVLGVWVPIFLMGAFSWDVAHRYMFSQVSLFLTALVAGLFYIWDKMEERIKIDRKFQFSTVFIFLMAITINPLELRAAVNRNYEKWPDHKGAAMFMKKKSLTKNDVVLAEDALQQMYYFGRVDFWLRAVSDASGRVWERGGKLYNIYTNVPLIGSGAELDSLLGDPDRGAVYIIGSGETYDDKAYFLGNGILEVIENNTPQVIFTGRDEKTIIWYFPAPGIWHLERHGSPKNGARQ